MRRGKNTEGPMAKVITVRLSDDEHKAIRSAAYRSEQSMNEFCREVLIQAAREILHDCRSAESRDSEAGATDQA